MRLPKLKTVAGLLLAPLVCVFASWCFLEALINRPSISRARLHFLEYRIQMFYEANHRLPGRLEDLPERPGRVDDDIVDAWGQPIKYTVDGLDVTLLSYGKDGQPGGTGKDEDIKRTFTVAEPTSKPARSCEAKPCKPE